VDPGFVFEAQVRRDIDAQKLLQPGQGVVVGVSGGADSMALLTVLHALGRRHGLPLEITVAHLDHGLRGAASERDAAFVSERARALGVRVESERSDGLGASAANLEERAREARSAFFARVADSVGAPSIAVGHTRDDQAETVLQRLARGGGVRSLAAMEPRRADGLVRPLLRRRRHECLAYLAAREVPFVEDDTNRDPAFTRNRIRHQLLPELSRGLGVDMGERLAALAGDLRVEAALAERQVEAVLARQEPDTLRVADVVAAGAGAGRIVHAWLASLGHRAQRAQIETLVEISRSGAASAGLDLADVRVERSYEVLTCRTPGQTTPGADRLRWEVPGALELGSGWLLMAEEAEGSQEAVSAEDPVVDRRAVREALTVRRPEPGDRIRLRAGRRKLSDLFIDLKIPRPERSRLAVVASGTDIIWVPGVAVAADVLPGKSTKRWMRLRAERVDCRQLGSVVEKRLFRVRFG